MIRPLTVSQLKNPKRKPLQPVPREGTRTRSIYDNLVKDGTVQLKSPKDYAIIENLRWSYNMDIINQGDKVYKFIG